MFKISSATARRSVLAAATSVLVFRGFAHAATNITSGGTTLTQSNSTNTNNATDYQAADDGTNPLLLTGNGTGLYTLSGAITDHDNSGKRIASVTKTGGSTFSLSSSGSNYSGGTTISGGTLLADGTHSTGTGSVAVNSGGILGGSGSISGPITVNSNGKITAGAGAALGATAGTLTTANLSFSGGSGYVWKLNNGSGAAGSGWDELATTGMSFASLTSSNPFTIYITGSPANLHAGTSSFTIATDPNSAITINGATVANGTYLTTGSGTPKALTTLFSLDTSSFHTSNSPGIGAPSFQLEVVGDGSGQDLRIVMTAAPEPGTVMLGLAGIVPTLGARRRRPRADAE